MARVSLKRDDVTETSRSLVVSRVLLCEDLHGTGDPLCVKPARAAGREGGGATTALWKSVCLPSIWSDCCSRVGGVREGGLEGRREGRKETHLQPQPLLSDTAPCW